jgi:hypothetical protein
MLTNRILVAAALLSATAATAVASRRVATSSDGSVASPLRSLIAASTYGESIVSQIVAVVTGSLMKLNGTSE